jgi:hypothetical protein
MRRAGKTTFLHQLRRENVLVYPAFHLWLHNNPFYA